MSKIKISPANIYNTQYHSTYRQYKKEKRQAYFNEHKKEIITASVIGSAFLLGGILLSLKKGSIKNFIQNKFNKISNPDKGKDNLIKAAQETIKDSTSSIAEKFKSAKIIINNTKTQTPVVPQKIIQTEEKIKKGIIPYQTPESFRAASFEYKDILRSMQFNNGKVPKRYIEQFEGQFRAIEIKHPDIKNRGFSAQRYVRARISEVLRNLKSQKNDLQKMLPSQEDTFLWRKVELNNGTVNFKNSLDYSNLIKKTGKGHTLVMDWSGMSAYEDIQTAMNHKGEDMFRIKVPKGSKLYNDMEKVIFPSKSKFKFLGESEYNGIMLRDFEYILP